MKQNDAMVESDMNQRYPRVLAKWHFVFAILVPPGTDMLCSVATSAGWNGGLEKFGAVN